MSKWESKERFEKLYERYEGASFADNWNRLIDLRQNNLNI
jgi:hypothetical protein